METSNPPAASVMGPPSEAGNRNGAGPATAQPAPGLGMKRSAKQAFEGMCLFHVSFAGFGKRCSSCVIMLNLFVPR